MHVAVAIVGYKNREDILLCLQSLGASTHVDFEVIICENGGPAAFEALKERVPATLPDGQRVRVMLAPGNLGFAGGINQCLQTTASADAWWLLNPDTLPRPSALGAMVNRLNVADCEAVGSTVHLTDGRVQSYGGRWSAWLATAESIGRGLPVGAPVDGAAVERQQNYLNGASMLIGRRFLEAAGLMREDYFLYCEEVEWCLRALSKGMKLGYAEDAVVVHEQGTTTGAGEAFVRRSRLPVYLAERNKILLTRDRFPFRLPVVIPAALLLLLLRCARYGAWKQFRYGLSGWASGISNVRGMPSWMSAD